MDSAAAATATAAATAAATAPPPPPPPPPPEPLPPGVQAVVRAGIDVLAPHTTTFRIIVRTRAHVVAFPIPPSVAVRARHIRAVERPAAPGAAWVQWTDTGLLLCVRVLRIRVPAVPRPSALDTLALVAPSPPSRKRRRSASWEG